MQDSILVELKKAGLLAFVLVLLSTLVFVRFIRPVEASGTIYIRADGSIEPSTAYITSADNVTYTFTYNIFDQTIVVEKDNIVVDGAGFTLQGAGAYHPRGIDLSGRSNVTIKNIRVSNTHYGIHLDESFNNSIVGNYITDNSNIALYSSSNNNVTGNNVANNQGNGIYFVDSSRNILSGNNITNNNSGIWLERSSNNTISRNNVICNYNGIWILRSSNNTIYHNNLINNRYHVFDISMELWYVSSSMNIWDDGVEGNLWSDYEDRYPNATELDDSGVWDTPYVIYGSNKDNYPLMHPLVAPPPLDITPPTIFIVSPENKTYAVKDVSLTFTVSETTSWIGYSLDGQANVTIAGNTTLRGLFDGMHSLIVYAKDTAGNTGASETIYFSIEPFPITWVIATMAIVAVVGAALLVYFRIIRKTTKLKNSS